MFLRRVGRIEAFGKILLPPTHSQRARGNRREFKPLEGWKGGTQRVLDRAKPWRIRFSHVVEARNKIFTFPAGQIRGVHGLRLSDRRARLDIQGVIERRRCEAQPEVLRFPK